MDYERNCKKQKINIQLVQNQLYYINLKCKTPKFLEFWGPIQTISFIFQFEINRKRDTELTKLRKLLEDVHLESEETAHLLKRKHQEIVVDFQDQIDQLTKSKARWGTAESFN